jgi:hypothetical protein
MSINECPVGGYVIVCTLGLKDSKLLRDEFLDWLHSG